MAGIFKGLRRVNRRPFHAMTVLEGRSAYVTATEAPVVPGAALERVEESDRPAADGAMFRARLCAHGGSFTIGNLETRDSLCPQLSPLRGNVAAVAAAYRLAPEHRYPRAVLDAWPAMQGLLANGLPLEAVGIECFFDHCIHRHQLDDWHFAPLLADVQDGVAPAWVIPAECDSVVAEGQAQADRLSAAGVPVDLGLYRGVTHDGHKTGRLLPETHVVQAASAMALKRAFQA